nr:MAG: hypothetical protein [Microvirus Sku211]
MRIALYVYAFDGSFEYKLPDAFNITSMNHFIKDHEDEIQVIKRYSNYSLDIEFKNESSFLGQIWQLRRG